MIGRAGYDWVGIDYQHGSMSLAGVDSMLCALAISRVPALVRVPSAYSGSDICRILDYGAAGIIVPVVNTAAEAAAAVAAARYEPEGIRSWAGPGVRAAMADPDYTPQTANAAVKCIMMIETLAAVDNIEEIVAVPGVDAVFVGPSDLAHSGGLAPSLFADDPKHVDRIVRVFRAAEEHGLVAGIYAGTVAAAKYWYGQGARLLALTDDSALLRMAAAAMVEDAQKWQPPTIAKAAAHDAALAS